MIGRGVQDGSVSAKFQKDANMDDIHGVHGSFLQVLAGSEPAGQPQRSILCSEILSGAGASVRAESDSQSLPTPLILDLCLGICIWAPIRKDAVQQWGCPWE